MEKLLLNTYLLSLTVDEIELNDEEIEFIEKFSQDCVSEEESI